MPAVPPVPTAGEVVCYGIFACSLRSLLKKLNQTVVVGDRVRMGTIDWRAGKAQVRTLFGHLKFVLLRRRSRRLPEPGVDQLRFML